MLPTRLKPRAKHRQFLLLGVLILTLGQIPSNAWAKIIYVKSGASGTGSLWTDATDLQTAISSATSGDEIWVAGGTYTPGPTRTDTFTLIDDVKIYGGFQGVQEDLGDYGYKSGDDNVTLSNGTKPRHTSTYKTTLSGDIGIASDNSDNSYHVVTAGSGIGSGTLLDGLTIQDGNADGTSTNENNGGGMLNSGSPKLTNVTFSNNSAVDGGGMYNDNGDPKLTKVTFSSNTASNDGGGMYNNGCSGLTISGGSFTGNTATNDGGGMYNLNCSPTISSSTITVTFSNNTATNGGGMYNNSSSPLVSRIFFKGNSAVDGAGIYNTNSSNPYIHHVIFSGNSATGNGGGMYSDGSSTSTITQTTFSGNSATAGGAMYNNNSTWTVNNSILWKNTGGEISYNPSNTTTVNNSIVDDGNTVPDPFVTSINPTDAPTTDGDFHLKTSASPPLDAGDNTKAVNSVGTTIDIDLDKNTRLIKATVDMGPYESQAPFVDSITCSSPNTCDNAGSPHNTTTVIFQVTFDGATQPPDLGVKGVEANDFVLTATSGSITVASGVSISNDENTLDTLLSSLSTSDYSIDFDGTTLKTTYTVTINLDDTSEGKLRLDVVDDDGITNEYDIPLGNTGKSQLVDPSNTSNIGVGDFNTGEEYYIDTVPPTIDSITDISNQINTSVDTITIVFSETIKDFALDDLSLTHDGNSVSLSGKTLANPSSDNKTWILSDLTGLTGNDGDYELTVTAAGITDNADNAVTVVTPGDNIETWAKVTNPTLDTNTGLTLPQGTSATITNTLLQVLDIQGPQGPADLTYTIDTSPANGTLKLNGTALSGTFTQDDIDNNNVTYEHNNSSTTNDSFDFTVSDGAGGSVTGTFNITITTTPNTSPKLDTNTGLILDQDTSTTITTTELQTTDGEQGAADLTYTIGTAPANGTLKLNGIALSGTFTQDDIDQNNLTYEHDNSSTTSDSFTFTIDDGAGGTVALTTFDMTITAVSNVTSPNVPTDLTATAISQTQINLSWVDNSDNETGFKIKREDTLIETTASDIESYNDTDLTCNTTYTYQVIATNDTGDSTTIEASATTHACDEEDNSSSSGGGTTPLPSKLNLTIKFGGKGSGSVKSDPSGIDCDSSDESCSYLFSTATSVTLTPTPANGSKFSSWGGHTDCGDAQVLMTSNISCTLFFQLLPSTLAITYEGNGTISSSPSGINCGDSCTDTFDGGTEVTLTATPDDGWTFDQWTGDCNSNGLVTIDSGKACHAIFVEEGTQETEVSLTPPYLKVTKIGEGTITSEPIAINCGGDCTQEYAVPGTEVTLTATPDEGWAFDKWEGDCDDNGQITITDQGEQCEAIFVQTTVPFVLNIAITGQGSVLSNPIGIDCGETCRYDYQSGMEIVLTATPDDAWGFEGWRGHCDASGKVVLDGQFNFKQCRAVFVEASKAEALDSESGLESKALALEIIGNGTVTSHPSGIDCGEDCTEDYVNDTEVTLTPTPDNDDWRFEGWTGDCNSEGYVFVDTEKHCEAIFVDANAEPFTLNVAITGNGSVTSEPTGIDCGATCSKEYATGLEVALNAISDNGWKFEGWRGHCDEIGKVVLNGEFNFKQCRAVFVEASKAEALDSESGLESKALALEITGNGTVTSQPSGINCGNDCTENYTNNTEVTLTSIPNTDWRFEGWTGDCNSEGYVFVDTEKRCEAIFVDANAEPFTLNVAITGNGSITSEPTGIDCGTTCSKEYATGLEVALNATPDDDWKFEGWRGHCDETGHVTLDGDFGFKQCRAIFVESIKIEDKSDDSETDSDSSTDDDSETNSSSSTNNDSETGSDSSPNDDSETDSSSSTNTNDNSETGSDSNTNTDGNSQTGTSAANQTTDNNQDGTTNTIENVGPNGGDGNNDGTLDSQQNNVLSLQNANGEYVTVAEKNGCTLNSNGNNLEFNCPQAEVDNYYYGVSDPSEVPQCQEPQVTCQVITIQGQSVVVASTTLNDGDVNNDRIAGDGKITQPLAPGQRVVVFSQNSNGSGTSSGNTANTSTGSTSITEEIDINLQSVATIIKVGETVNLAIGGIDGIFFIKEMPELALVAVDEDTLINNGELTLIGLAVGNTQMIITDQVSSQEVTLYIKVLPAVTLEEESTSSKDIGLKTRLTTLKVGQIVTLMIADGQGMLSIIGSPDDTLVSLSDWIAYGDGTADVTLKGLQAGSTQLMVKDSAIPSQQTALHIIVIGSSNDATSVNPPETPITDTTIAISLDDSPCEPLNALGIDAVGHLIESNACFVGKVSLQGILQSNDRQLTRRESQTLRVSARIQVAPEHVAQPAEILLVGAYSPSKAETMFYTRDEQTWFMWDEQISHLIIAQEHPVLPEIIDVFIFEGDLSFMPGEFTVYVGYRLLENGTIIYNGLEPIHFFVGNR